MSLQALPSITGHVHSPDLLEPVPKKPRFEAMKSPFSDISEASSVSGSCLPHSSQISEELQQTFDTSSQVQQATFIAVVKSRVHSHESMGSPVSLVVVVVSRLGTVRLPEIKRPGQLYLDAHAHMRVHGFWTTQLGAESHQTARASREEVFLLSSATEDGEFVPCMRLWQTLSCSSLFPVDAGAQSGGGEAAAAGLTL